MPWRGSAESDQADLRAPRILFELAEHSRDFGVVDAASAPARRNIVVGKPECEFGMRDAPAACADLIERKERSLMQEMAVDPQEARPVLARPDRVGVPELVDEGPASS